MRHSTRPSDLGHPSTKYYYFNEYGRLVSSYELPDFEDLPPNFLFMKVEVLELNYKEDKKTVQLTPYIGINELKTGSAKVIINDYDKRDAGKRMFISMKLLKIIESRLEDIRKWLKSPNVKNKHIDISDSTLKHNKYMEYYKTNDPYPYKPRILTTVQKNDPEFMRQLKINETLGLERKKKVLKSKIKRKPVKKCSCRKK